MNNFFNVIMRQASEQFCENVLKSICFQLNKKSILSTKYLIFSLLIYKYIYRDLIALKIWLMLGMYVHDLIFRELKYNRLSQFRTLTN